MARRLFAPDSPDFTPDSLVAFSPQCLLELAVRATIPGALDSPACGTGQSGVPDCVVSWLHTGTLFQSFSFPVSST